MNSQHDFFVRINNAINWNGFSYTIYKVTNTALTFSLYRVLSTQQFALWAGINSIIYLIILWADCGMRKAIPRFIPLFSPGQHKYFIQLVVCVHGMINLIACPIVIFMIHRYATGLGITLSMSLLGIMVIIFVAQSIEGMLKSIFHAHLWNKTYNSLSIIIMTVYTIIVLMIVMCTAPDNLFLLLFVGTAIVSTLYVCIGMWLLHLRLSDISATPEKVEAKAFIQLATHAGCMWATTIAKSFSERNVTVPFVTITLGPIAGNLFKVAQDGALLLQRMVLKSIGTADISLFAVVHNQHNTQLNSAFAQLITKISWLCMPLLGFISFLSLHAFSNPSVPPWLMLSIPIALYLLLELLLMPYERLLEVGAHYKQLTYIYCMYLCALAALFALGWHAWFSLTSFIMVLYAIRLVSFCSMWFCATRVYAIRFPFQAIAPLFAVTLFIGALCHIVALYTISPNSSFFSLLG